jgi:hypothetical protein
MNAEKESNQHLIRMSTSTRPRHLRGGATWPGITAPASSTSDRFDFMKAIGLKSAIMALAAGS